jgi:hypothetical protein
MKTLTKGVLIFSAVLVLGFCASLIGSCGTTGTLDPASQAALAQAEQLALQYAEQYLAQHGGATSITTPSAQASITKATAAIVPKVPSVPPPVVKDIVVAKHVEVIKKVTP